MTHLRLLSLAVLLAQAPALADVNFSNFNSTTGLSLLGDAGTAAGRLLVTPDANNQIGAAWFQTRQLVSASWETEFDFGFTGAPGTDGLAFVVQNTGTAQLGGGGCELGYDGILNGVAVELDTWQNLACFGVVTNDPVLTHVSVHTSGTGALSIREATSLGSTTSLPTLSDGLVHTARVQYAPGTLNVYVDDLFNPVLSVAIDLDATLSLTSGMAYVGFTAATSGGSGQAHEVLSWSFTENSSPPTGNSSPAAPTINEPSADGLVLNPFDVHMETSVFSDADVGDQHLCTDWEIWSISPSERVWLGSCVTGPEAVHAHLADGAFIGSLAGETALDGNTSYRLRVRHSDDSGDPITRWSPWTERLFVTGAQTSIFPLEVDDAIVPPQPVWRTTGGAEVVLPSGFTPANLSLENPTGAPILTVAGFDDAVNTVIDADELPEHEALRVRISGGSTGVVLPESDFTFTDHECESHTILLPAISLGLSQSIDFWVSFDGSTYDATPAQTEPDFSTLARGQDFPWVVQEGFEIDVFASGLRLPVNIAFVPNPAPGPDAAFLYVTELYGAIKVVTRSGAVSDYAANLLDYTPSGAFPGSGEQGLTGICVDPATGDVFAAMLYDSMAFPGTGYPKVVRLSSNDGGLTAATQTTILDMFGESQGQSHQISHLELHPDGKLRVHMGDGFVASTAQQASSFRGKILRVNLDGTAPTDNPFYNAGNGIGARDYQWVTGVRNPFGGSYRYTDGDYYVVENGPSVDRFARVSAGINMGWNGSDASMQINALYNWFPATGPVNLAFVEPQVFGGSGFPALFQGRGYVTESGPTYAAGAQALGKRISQWRFDTGNPVLDPDDPYLAEYVGTGRATAVGLAAGPDGLYMTELYADDGGFPTQSGARLLRIRHTGGGDCNENGVSDVCEIATGEASDLDGDMIPDECSGSGVFCSGDGGDQAGCTDCPCGNNALPGTVGGCLNTAGRSARILATGLASASADTLRIELEGGVPNTFAVLTSGASRAPANAQNPCFGLDSGLTSAILDGLRCVVQSTQRHGSRAIDAAGDVGATTPGWGPPNGPPGGILAQGGFGAGQTRHFQVFYREDDQAGCMTGVGTSDAVTAVVQP